MGEPRPATDPLLSFPQWLLRWLAVDGVLPVATFLAPQLVAWRWPNDPSAAFIATFLMVPIVAVYRAGRAYEQIALFTGGVRWWRQILFGLAIVVLMLFDGVAAVIAFSQPGKGPRVPWELPIGLVACYLALTAMALWPPQGFRQPPEVATLDSC